MPTFGSTRSRVLSLTAVAAIVPLALAGCGGSGDSGGSGGGAQATASGGIQLVSPGNLTVCTHLPYKPFEFNEGGQVVGFDIDMVDLVAEKLGVERQMVDITFDQITSGAVFRAKKCDMAAGGMTINDKRREAVLFSEPYFDATQALLTKKGSGLNSLASLRGKRVGVQTDTTGQQYVNDNAAANGYTAVVFDDVATEVNGVKSGRVDAAVNDNGVLYDFVKDNPDTEVTAEFHTGEQYGMAAAKDDANAQALMDVFNAALAESRRNGQYDEIYRKWFGTTPGVTEQGASGSASPTTSAPAGASSAASPSASS